MLKRFYLLVFYFGFSLGLQAQDISVDELLDQYFENTGGIDNWKKLNTMRMTGLMSMGGMEFKGVITHARPNKQRVEVDVQGNSIIQAYDGEDAWWINPFQTGPDPQSMPEDVAESILKNEFEDALIDYAEKGYTVELLGTIEIEGTATYEVKLTKENSDVVYYYFDKEYYVPIMQKSEVTSGPMKGQFVETYMSDYQDVEGMMIPYFVEVKIGGSTGQTITLQNVELNPQVDDLFFSRPKKD